jgi:hypothetical protein
LTSFPSILYYINRIAILYKDCKAFSTEVRNKKGQEQNAVIYPLSSTARKKTKKMTPWDPGEDSAPGVTKGEIARSAGVTVRQQPETCVFTVTPLKRAAALLTDAARAIFLLFR